MKLWKTEAWSDEICFLLRHMDGCTKELAPGCTVGRRQIYSDNAKKSKELKMQVIKIFFNHNVYLSLWYLHQISQIKQICL